MKAHYAMLAVVVLSLTACGAMRNTASEQSTTSAESYISGSDFGVAIGGYDTVSYWTEEKAVRGDRDFSVQWAGTVWVFSSREHMKMFRENPEKYAPKYGGHCATSVAYGNASRGNGQAWVVFDGHLYLFGSKDVREQWLDGMTHKLIRKADNEWPRMKGSLLAQ